MNKTAYLFSICLWRFDDPVYILVYAENEQEARVLGSEQVKYNDGSSVKPEDLRICTYGL